MNAPTQAEIKAFEDKAKHALGIAVTDLILDFPFYATLVLHLQRVVAWDIPTMATDGKRLYYNPSFVTQLPRAELLGVLCHEGCHVANLHCLRREGRDPSAWNIACDHVVNYLVAELARLKLPQGCIPPINDTPERLYKQPPPCPQCGGQNGQHNPGCSKPGPDYGCGGVMDAIDEQGKPLTGAAKQEAIADTKLRVKRALNAAKAAGKLPAGMERHFDDVLAPVLPWRELLARFISDVTRDDYSWRQPNRRYMASHDVYLPSARMPRVARIIFAVDTSGSMTDALIQKAVAEVNGCLQAAASMGRATLTVAWCDTELHEQDIENVAQCRPKGGGGTSYVEVIDHYRKEDVVAVIYLTDGYCSDFTREQESPDYAVLWLLIEGHNDSFAPPWGEVIEMTGGD